MHDSVENEAKYEKPGCIPDDGRHERGRGGVHGEAEEAVGEGGCTRVSVRVWEDDQRHDDIQSDSRSIHGCEWASAPT